MFEFSFGNTLIGCTYIQLSIFKAVVSYACCTKPLIPSWCWAVAIALNHRNENWGTEHDFLSIPQYIWVTVEKTVLQTLSWPLPFICTVTLDTHLIYCDPFCLGRLCSFLGKTLGLQEKISVKSCNEKYQWICPWVGTKCKLEYGTELGVLTEMCGWILL